MGRFSAVGGGQPFTSRGLVERFRKLRTGVGFQASPYTLRHTFATGAILQGVDLITIKELMGHEDLRMLEKSISTLRGGLVEDGCSVRNERGTTTGQRRYA